MQNSGSICPFNCGRDCHIVAVNDIDVCMKLSQFACTCHHKGDVCKWNNVHIWLRQWIIKPVEQTHIISVGCTHHNGHADNWGACSFIPNNLSSSELVYFGWFMVCFRNSQPFRKCKFLTVKTRIVRGCSRARPMSIATGMELLRCTEVY